MLRIFLLLIYFNKYGQINGHGFIHPLHIKLIFDHDTTQYIMYHYVYGTDLYIVHKYKRAYTHVESKINKQCKINLEIKVANPEVKYIDIHLRAFFFCFSVLV